MSVHLLEPSVNVVSLLFLSNHSKTLLCHRCRFKKEMYYHYNGDHGYLVYIFVWSICTPGPLLFQSYIFNSLLIPTARVHAQIYDYLYPRDFYTGTQLSLNSRSSVPVMGSSTGIFYSTWFSTFLINIYIYILNIYRTFI